MGYTGMWAPPGADPRDDLPTGHGEKAVLAEYLDHYRLTIELKCEGLTPEQLATRSVPPSTMSLLGLVRHLARVEHSWTRRVFEGEPDLPRLYRTEAEPDLDAPIEANGNTVQSRDIVVHLIEEYARHAGHADLLRECIDGRTGL